MALGFNPGPIFSPVKYLANQAIIQLLAVEITETGVDRIPGDRRASRSKTSIREEAENVAKTAEGRRKSEWQPGNHQGGKNRKQTE